MAHAIPRLQYDSTSITGDTTNGSNTILNVTPLLDIAIGRTIVGPGIPLNSVISNVVGSTVTLSQKATATAVGAALECVDEIIFDYPPIETEGETLDPKDRQSDSIAGARQVSIDFIEAQRSLVFSFLSQSKKEQMDAFFKNWAIIGNTFRYFDDKTTDTYVEWELSKRKYTPKKITAKGGGYVWSVAAEFRRVVA